MKKLLVIILITIIGWAGIMEGQAFNWNRLKEKNGFYSYQDKNYRSVTVIDVSNHQGDIDWVAVRKSGIKYAYIRASYRGIVNWGLNEDKRFKTNIVAAKKAGLKVGVYHFSKAITYKEIAADAKYFLNLIKGYQLDLPVAFDYEFGSKPDRLNTISKNKRTKITLRFIKIMKKNKYKTIIYGNKHWFKTGVNYQKLKKYPIWLANYNKRPPKGYKFKIWQYSESMTISGINHKTDVNLMLIKKKT